MTDQKDNQESKCPFFNPNAQVNKTPQQQPPTHHQPLPKQRNNTVRLLLWCVLLVVALYSGYLYFSHPHNAPVPVSAPVTATVPDSGKDSTLVNPTTATNADTQEHLPTTEQAESTS